MSINPGATTSPRASMTRFAVTSAPRWPIAAIRSPRIAMSPSNQGFPVPFDDLAPADHDVIRLRGRSWPKARVVEATKDRSIHPRRVRSMVGCPQIVGA